MLKKRPVFHKYEHMEMFRGFLFHFALYTMQFSNKMTI